MGNDKKKNNPVGVRFNDTYEELKMAEATVTTHQKALNFLFEFWKSHRVIGARTVTGRVPVPKAGVQKGDVLSEKSSKRIDFEKEFKDLPLRKKDGKVIETPATTKVGTSKSYSKNKKGVTIEHEEIDLGDTIKLAPLPKDFKKIDKIVATTSFKEQGEIAKLTEQLKNPPANLKGIDLTMWKSGIKEKINELSTPKK